MMRLDPASSDEGPNREESESSMRRGKAMHQKSMQMELHWGVGVKPRGTRAAVKPDGRLMGKNAQEATT